MDPVQLEKLRAIRSRKDLSLRPNKFLRPTIVGFDGVERPFVIRYYQIQAILHLLASKGFVLGDDCGLGKSPCSIAALCFLWEKDPTLKAIILTNKSAVDQWAGEFHKFTIGIHVIVCKGTPKQREKAREEFLSYDQGPVVMILGYRAAVQDFSELQDLKGYLLVADECAAFKTPTTQIHKVVAHLRLQSERIWGLTATIIKNHLIEGWGIFSVITPGLFGNKGNFMDEFCITRMQTIPGTRRQIPIIVGYRPAAIQRFKDTIDPYFLGRSKMEVASDLPPLITSTIKVGMSNTQRAKYNEALEGLLEVGVVHKNESGTTSLIGTEEKEVSKLTAVAYCQLISDHPELINVEGESEKLNALMDLLTNGELEGEKVIVFSRFRKMVDILMRELKAAKIQAVRIDGQCNEKQRKAAQDAFQDVKSNVKVICITTAASEAINLQAAKALVFYDTPWSGGEYLQILGRMIRIGSLNDRCYAMHLVTENSIDERIMKVLGKKMGLIEAVIGKRIKGEGDDDVIVSAENDISDLFTQLVQDARNVKGKKP